MNSEALSLLVLAFLFIGWLPFHKIDHRWYCGRTHRAHEKCEPSERWLQRQKLYEKRIAMAEAHEEEARRLRRLLW